VDLPVVIPTALALPVIAWLVVENRRWQDRWAKEVKRGAELYNARPPAGQPEHPPPPEWDENTRVRQMREAETRKAVDAQLERYLDSTPPGVPHPKR
jgi:hypothetical protein